MFRTRSGNVDFIKKEIVQGRPAERVSRAIQKTEALERVRTKVAKKIVQESPGGEFTREFVAKIKNQIRSMNFIGSLFYEPGKSKKKQTVPEIAYDFMLTLQRSGKKAEAEKEKFRECVELGAKIGLDKDCAAAMFLATAKKGTKNRFLAVGPGIGEKLESHFSLGEEEAKKLHKSELKKKNSKEIVFEAGDSSEKEEAEKLHKSELKKKNSEEIVFEAGDSSEKGEEEAETLVEEKHADAPKVDTLTLNTARNTAEEKVAIAELLEKYSACFAQNSRDIGKFNHVSCTIQTAGSFAPVRLAKKLSDPAKEEFLKNKLQEMEEDGIVSKVCSSEYGSIVTLAPKKDSFRLCTNYVRLNEITVKETYQMPTIPALLEKVKKANYFSNLDLISGYWQVPMAEEDKEKTALVTSYGTHIWNVMPFGLCNSSAIFQKAMDDIFVGLDFVAVYIDDIVVFSSTYDEHLVHLEEVFRRFIGVGGKLNTSKCELIQRKIKFLGRVVSNGGVALVDESSLKFKNVTRPKTLGDIMKLQGLVNSCYGFLENIVDYYAPLNSLLKKNSSSVWGAEQERAYRKIKQIASDGLPNLPHLVDGRDIIFRTSANSNGVSIVVSQAGEKREIVKYEGKVLDDKKSKYTSEEKECHAVLWILKRYERECVGRRVFVETSRETVGLLRRESGWTESLETLKTLCIAGEVKRMGLLYSLREYPWRWMHKAVEETGIVFGEMESLLAGVQRSFRGSVCLGMEKNRRILVVSDFILCMDFCSRKAFLISQEKNRVEIVCVGGDVCSVSVQKKSYVKALCLMKKYDFILDAYSGVSEKTAKAMRRIKKVFKRHIAIDPVYI
ncbi:MAG: uncharacterized protein A8A55_0683 [Amphiamblys sp. WSBS2006]|nr:MAG: uncharacterized protein A8A55_0683 [Amphiamblys sp. WSBS2006]